MRSTSWVKQVKVIADETRSGASKRRIGVTATPNTYSVGLHFSNETEYQKFITWYEKEDLNGFYPFALKKIDKVNGELYAYRFLASSSLNVNNTGGHVYEVSFDVEELYKI